MRRGDQNKVTLGPARVKVEDSIYNAVDQGIVTATTTTTTTTTTPGFTPVGDVGDLITPPVITPVTGYPMTEPALNLATGSLSPLTAWGVLDLSAIGSFSNALVLGIDNSGGGSSLSFINLDNPSQKTTYANKIKQEPVDFVVRDEKLTHGLDVFNLGTWTNPSYTLEIDSGTMVKTASQMEERYNAYGINDSTYRYFSVENSVGSGFFHHYKQLHTGTLAPVYIASEGLSGQTGYTLAVAGNYLWSSIGNYVFAINLVTGAVTDLYSATGLFSQGYFWGMADGSLAGLKETIVGSNYVYDLAIINPFGGLTTQAALATLPQTYAWQRSITVPNSGTMLVVFYDVSTGLDHLIQFSPAGYQEITPPTARVRGLRFNPLLSGNLVRWWGSAVDGTGAALYEGSV